MYDLLLFNIHPSSTGTRTTSTHNELKTSSSKYISFHLQSCTIPNRNKKTVGCSSSPSSYFYFPTIAAYFKRRLCSRRERYSQEIVENNASVEYQSPGDSLPQTKSSGTQFTTLLRLKYNILLPRRAVLYPKYS
jgi:hypothetical protein